MGRMQKVQRFFPRNFAVFYLHLNHVLILIQINLYIDRLFSHVLAFIISENKMCRVNGFEGAGTYVDRAL